MKRSLSSLVALLLLGGISLFVNPARADVILTQGSLSATIRSDNGAINNVTFGGTEFYREGTFVSDFGFQLGTTASSFRINTANGFAGTPVSVVGVAGTAVVTGTFTGGGANIAFTRTYSLVPGENVLRTTTTFTNNGSTATLRLFDTFDPDQGIDLGVGFGTFNDVFNLGGIANVAEASANQSGPTYTVVIGSLLAGSTVASGFPFSIGSGTDLNNFFTSPFDGNDGFADQGSHIGASFNLASGASGSFTFDQAFGTTPGGARQDFLDANAAVPEPASFVVFGLAALAAGYYTRRRRATVPVVV